MKMPNFIFWVAKGFYYFLSGGWKYSNDQTNLEENENRKFFSSESDAENKGYKVQK